MHTVCMFRRHTDSRFNAHFKDQLLQTPARICAQKAAHKAQKTSLLIKSTAVRLYTQSVEKTFNTAKQLQCPEDIFHQTLKWIHLKLVSNIT